ncbi:hypothetical protein Y1Q_0004193 [Alligator mississippiensis]|uniref:Uncharacterized protein n=1 Tax=Alligator mississippiensis TaxID=8496 RepID=A0A151PIB6_ALLMI|nr:hypothetical protein Y1Q_0004193 [Alligator mississippiensis]
MTRAPALCSSAVTYSTSAQQPCNSPVGRLGKMLDKISGMKCPPQVWEKRQIQPKLNTRQTELGSCGSAHFPVRTDVLLISFSTFMSYYALSHAFLP